MPPPMIASIMPNAIFLLCIASDNEIAEITTNIIKIKLSHLLKSVNVLFIVSKFSASIEV